MCLIDEEVAAHIIYENRHAQAQNGHALMQICQRVGRCSICTLKPPCRHKPFVDNSVHPDLIGLSPKKI